MRHRRPSIVFAAALLCLVVAAGCGSSTTANFKAGYSAARLPLNRTFVEVRNAFTHARGKTVAQLGRTFGTLAARFGSELTALEALKPPSRAATAFDTLKASLARMEGDLKRAAAALKAKQVVAGASWLERLTSDAGAATDAANAVTRDLVDR